MPVLPAFLTIIDFLFPFSTHRIPTTTNPSPENVSLHDCGRDSPTSGRCTTISFSQRSRANPTIVIFAETLFGTIGAGVRQARSTLVTKFVTLPTTRTFVFSTTTRNVYASSSRAAAVNDNFFELFSWILDRHADTRLYGRQLLSGFHRRQLFTFSFSLTRVPDRKSRINAAAARIVEVGG